MFVIYNADLPIVIKRRSHHGYDDDVQLYISVNPINLYETQTYMNDDQEIVADWSAKVQVYCIW